MVVRIRSLSFLLFAGIVICSACRTLPPDRPAASSAGTAVTAEQPAGAPEPATPGEIPVTEVAFDPETLELTYRLPRPGQCRIRIGLKDGGPLLNTLVDWESRPEGINRERWDGRDQQGVAEYAGRDDVMITVACVDAGAMNAGVRVGTVMGTGATPRVNVTLPQALPSADGQQQVVRGTTPVRIFIDPEDIAWLTNVKYEVGLYVDGVFVAEDEEGLNPYTYPLDTRRLNDGTHALTVNIVAYSGEMASQSIGFVIDNKR